MAEESVALAVRGRTNPVFLSEDDVETLLDRHPEGNLELSAIIREVQKSLVWYETNTASFEDLAVKRSAVLLEDHLRGRKTSRSRGTTRVEPCLPCDLIGVYVLLPHSV